MSSKRSEESNRAALRRPIESVDAFVVVVDTPSHFSFGVWENRIHAFVRMVSGALEGWSEVMLPSGPVAREQMDHAAGQLAPLGALTGLQLEHVHDHLVARRSQWAPMLIEAADIAATDLCARAQRISALAYLELRSRAAVPAVYCVLDDDPDRVGRKMTEGLSLGFSSHQKVKLFGAVDLDEKIVAAARDVVGETTYLIGDANRGYGYRETGFEPDRIVDALRRLRAKGLTAAEDPAELTLEEWRSTRQRVEPLHLIMDRAIRPAWDGIEVAREGLVDAYNLHPGRMGTLSATTALAGRVREVGARLMVGDSSFVGPGCPIWQQLAIGMGADWCEAVEKPWEDDTFSSVCSRNPIARTGSRFSLVEEPEGFGIEIDAEHLASLSRRRWTIH
jgi:L-alanine-DL-glutamate epimerase-like enolase superfamily enzyme